MGKFLKDISVNFKVEDPYTIVESMGQPLTPILIPGHLYALSIDPGFQISPEYIPYNEREYKDDIDKKINITKKPYYDTMPIGIALRLNNENYQSILNLKLMRPAYRRLILESYYNLMGLKNNFIEPYVKDDLTKIVKPIIERIRDQSYLEPYLAVNEGFMKNCVGSSVKFAVKNYEINSIKNVRILDWNSLPKIYNMAISDRGITLNPKIGGLDQIFEIFESKFL